MLLEIIPLQGVGQIRFGMTANQVQIVMRDVYHQNKAANVNSIDYFFNNALEVSYDEDGFVEFIGTQYFTGCGCDFEIYGVDPFDTDAQSLFQHIMSRETTQHSFDENEYVFRENIITLWNADEQYDYKGQQSRKVYGQVGVGNPKYLLAIDNI